MSLEVVVAVTLAEATLVDVLASPEAPAEGLSCYLAGEAALLDNGPLLNASSVVTPAPRLVGFVTEYLGFSYRMAAPAAEVASRAPTTKVERFLNRRILVAWKMDAGTGLL